MDFPDRFADADAGFDEAEFCIFGVPFDGTTAFRPGTAEGPAAIRQGSWNFEKLLYDRRIDLGDVPYADLGDVEVPDVGTMAKNVEAKTREILDAGKVPICLGGEHSLTPHVVKAYDPPPDVVILDAHLDYRDEYEGEPLSHACVTRRLKDHLGIDHLVMAGIRSAEEASLMQAEEDGLAFIDASQVRDHGLELWLAEAVENLPGEGVYLSIDIDVIDPSHAPGVGTPEPFGLTPQEIVTTIRNLAPGLVGLDLVEVSPPHDNGNTAALAARLVREALGEAWVARQGG